MTNRLRLIIFDIDGTLADSQDDIVSAMAYAFERAQLTPPPARDVRGIIGLSLDEALGHLSPDLSSSLRAKMVNWYKEAYIELRMRSGTAVSSPLFPHVRETLKTLHAVPNFMIAAATGKSRRGLDKLLDGHELRNYFVNLQTSDDHPSKPHPSMIEAALYETGTQVCDAVMIGDTRFDMGMARAAKVHALGVTWGYHDLTAPTDADALISDIRALPEYLASLWNDTASGGQKR